MMKTMLLQGRFPMMVRIGIILKIRKKKKELLEVISRIINYGALTIKSGEGGRI